jgi:hypothetical protein
VTKAYHHFGVRNPDELAENPDELAEIVTKRRGL